MLSQGLNSPKSSTPTSHLTTTAASTTLSAAPALAAQSPTSTQRGLSTLAVVRQQHLQLQQPIPPGQLNASLPIPTPSNVIQSTSNQTTVSPRPQLHQQQTSVVLPVRTTPLPQSPATFPITQVIQNPVVPAASSPGIAPPTLPTHPAAGTIQTVKIGGQTQVNLAGIPRTMTTTTLTAQQLQQLTGARSGQVFSSIQNALRANAVVGQRAQLITRPASSTTSTMLRPQTITGQVAAINQQQARPPTIALQRPIGTAPATQQQISGTPIALAVAGAGAAPRAQTIALNAAASTGIRTAGQIVMSQGGMTNTTNSAAVAARQQQIVVATSAPHPAGNATGGLTRHIVMTHSGGTPVRSGQILQVTGQGGHQHQIVVSQSGQIILNPSSSKQ